MEELYTILEVILYTSLGVVVGYAIAFGVLWLYDSIRRKH
jgi:hypothetical protein